MSNNNSILLAAQMSRADSLRMWLADPVTQELIQWADKQADIKLRAAILLRRTDPAKLSDAIAEVELLKQLKLALETGTFLNP